jgi:hypothetical protein
MEATGGDSEAAAPSKALLEVRQCIAELTAEEALAQPTHDAAQSLAAVAAGDLSGLARQVLFEEAKLRSIEALRAEGEEQSEARSRVNEIEAQLRETQISLEETERQRPRGAADRLVVFRNDQGD